MMVGTFVDVHEKKSPISAQTAAKISAIEERERQRKLALARCVICIDGMLLI